MGKERQTSVTRGKGGRGRASEERRGRVRDVGEGEGEARDGDAWGEGEGAAPLHLTTTTTTTTSTAGTTRPTDLGAHITNASTSTHISSADQSTRTKDNGRALLGEQAEEGSKSTFYTNETQTIKQEDNPSNTLLRQFDTPTPKATPPRIRLRLTNTPGGTSQSPLPRVSPEPHPQPKRYRLKFTKHVLDKAQAKEAQQREQIETLLQRQLDDAVCVSTFVRQRDLEIMPSLEGPLSLRSGRPKRGGSPVVECVQKGRTGNGHDMRNGSVGLERERAVGSNAGRRFRDKEGRMNGDTIHVEKVPVPKQQVNTIITITEAPKPPRPKKMELELRIDDNSQPNANSKDKETLERNIDSVIFGEITFKAWYPSWYPKEIIGEKALTVGAGEKGGIVVSELYVCKRCFGYGKVLVEWVRHCKGCVREVPGKKVYVHGGWREDDAPRASNGEWSIWEVDGGVETLFCQNLSLFAKLFLDNKSVFFDVSGFNYFLLVYTPPLNSPYNPSFPPNKQIIGFFSKEKLSWDNNNLACILIFPPWQRKGLGALLMGVSYAIARREQILGGPEKPISELGRKGYARFWGKEIARWILERPEGRRKRAKGGGKPGRREEEVVGIRQLSEETWIMMEDCLGVLRDMGVVERVADKRGSSALEMGGEGGEEEGKERERIKVRIDKEAVRRWCVKEKIGLDKVVTEEGFRPGYAERVEEIEEEGEEGDVEVEGDVEMAG